MCKEANLEHLWTTIGCFINQLKQVKLPKNLLFAFFLHILYLKIMLLLPYYATHPVSCQGTH